MTTIKNFQEKLEQDLARVTAEIEKRRERAPEMSSREVLKQSLAAAAPPPIIAKEVHRESPLPAPSASEQERIPSYLSEEAPEVKAEVERLVTLALAKGLAPAVEEAAKKSPFMLDALHDALADKLLPELEKRGII